MKKILVLSLGVVLLTGCNKQILDLFIKENPQYEYIKVVPEKVKTKVRRKK